MSRWPNRDTVSGQENFSKSETVTRFYPNVTRFWWFFKFFTVTKPNRDTLLAKRDTIFPAYK